MMGTIDYALLAVLFFMAGCGSTASLTQQEKVKLDPALQQVLEGEQSSERKMDVSLRKDGTKLYGVIISIKDNVKSNDLGIHCNTVQPGMVTAKLTVEEIRQVVKKDEVLRIDSGSKAYINQ